MLISSENASYLSVRLTQWLLNSPNCRPEQLCSQSFHFTLTSLCMQIHSSENIEDTDSKENYILRRRSKMVAFVYLSTDLLLMRKKIFVYGFVVEIIICKCCTS